jgi:arylsulfatase A-like enzyme
MLNPVCIALTLLTVTSFAGTKPNVIFILADDLGYTDVASYGSKYYETPHIDKLAAQGMKLTSHHHCQNCQPTRAALMSGQYGPRTGVYTVGAIGRFGWETRPLRPVENVTELPLDRSTVAQALKGVGYATAMFGKWHLGEKGPHHPSKRGFDEAIVSASNHYHFDTNPKTEYAKGTYLADFLTDRAVDFITRNKDKPFFLYLPHFGVHSPHKAKPELIERFKSKPGIAGHNNPTYAAMIASIDESVGRVMATLDALKLTDNTLLIFASDNGGVGGYERDGIQGGSITDNWPLRNGKGSLYEGGTRVPFIARWPGITKPGTQSSVPTTHVDLYPTLLEIAGAPPPANQPLDGASLLPLLKDSSSSLDRSAIYQHFPGYLGAGANTWRTLPVATCIAGDWKLMEFMEDQRLELYNLKDDVSEQHNLASSQPEKAKELQTQLHAWQTSVAAKMPAKNENIQNKATPKQGKGKGKRKAAKTAEAANN